MRTRRWVEAVCGPWKDPAVEVGISAEVEVAGVVGVVVGMGMMMVTTVDVVVAVARW